MAEETKPKPRCIRCGERFSHEEQNARCPKCGGPIDKAGTFPLLKFGVAQASGADEDRGRAAKRIGERISRHTQPQRLQEPQAPTTP